MKDKIISLLAIFFIYLVSITLSLVVYYQIKQFDLILRLAISSLFLTTIIYLAGIMLKNMSIYDPYWSLMPPLLILFIMIETNNFNSNMLLALTAISIWAIRLTANFIIHWKDFSTQDFRYDRYKTKYPKYYFAIAYFGIMLFPTFITFIQVMLLAHVAVIKNFSYLLSTIAFLVILLATIIQLVADYQMISFKKDNNNKGKIINQGLWKYSRHPNYFAEILIWIGLYLFHLDAFGISLAVISPLLMILMFVFISIPLMENKLLTKYPDYLEYKKKTSMLIPFFKRR